MEKNLFTRALEEVESTNQISNFLTQDLNDLVPLNAYLKGV